MAAAPRDASKEHAPVEKKKDSSGHPRPRKGATAKKRAKENAARERMANEGSRTDKLAPSPAKRKK